MSARKSITLAMLVAFAVTALVGGIVVAQEPSLIIGLLLPGPKNDAGYNQTFYDGVLEVEANIPGVEVLVAEWVTDADAESTMETMILQGAKLILPCGFAFQYPALAVSQRHPDVVFMHPGGWESTHNFINFFATTQLEFFLMGVAAGMMTETDKIGFIAGMPLGYMTGNVNGFHLGARAVNPDVETHLLLTFAWYDPTKEVAAVQALLDQGCDVISYHLDSPSAVIQAAEAAGAYTIGFMSKGAQAYAPNGWITGLVLSWGDYFTENAQAVIDGTWQGYRWDRQGFAEGMLEIAPFGDAVPERVQQFVLAVAEGYKAGLINT
ncbi:BMP family ABC transporter substrate-binding protein, partial [Candidatus Bipolaricaulota bacterium]|nr:BMP family ABC transporter substrate-binding protein [Candidatus Bipolaricaulota bacterium]